MQQKVKLTKDEWRKSVLQMCQEIHNFCDKHSIRYFLAYGSMLGAVRHNGFIPWDDDFDIMMTYDDYVKFRNMWDNSGRYKIIDCNNDKGYLYTFPRVYDSLTYSESYGYKYHGVCIDCYLIYSGSSNTQLMNKAIIKVRKERRLAAKLARVRNGLMKTHMWFRKTSNFYLLNLLVRHTYKKMQHMPDDGRTSYITSDPYIYPKCIFDETIECTFEHYQFLIPKRYDVFLTIKYNNYMQFPPLEDQKPRHISAYYWNTDYEQ